MHKLMFKKNITQLNVLNSSFLISETYISKKVE